MYMQTRAARRIQGSYGVNIVSERSDSVTRNELRYHIGVGAYDGPRPRRQIVLQIPLRGGMRR